MKLAISPVSAFGTARKGAAKEKASLSVLEFAILLRITVSKLPCLAIFSAALFAQDKMFLASSLALLLASWRAFIISSCLIARFLSSTEVWGEFFIKFRLLRKIKPDKEKTEKSFEISKHRLNEAEKVLKLKIFEYAILESYMAMFHASRALLYKDGIQEKSHFAVFIYLKEKYKNKIPLHILNLLNIHRTERHEAMYGLEYKPTEEDALTAIEDANAFVREIEKCI